MDSINQQQPEEHRADLTGERAIRKLRQLVEQAQNCFFCTSRAMSETGGTRPMNVREVDEGGVLWFLSASDSRKNAEIAGDPNVRLYFQGSTSSDFLRLDGVADVVSDRKKVDELWSPILRTWFTGGKDDPRISVIRVRPTGGYYWDNKHGNAVAGAKILIGAALGRTLDDSIEGRIDPT